MATISDVRVAGAAAAGAPTTVGAPAIDDLIARVESTVQRYAATSEAERRLAPEVMAALIDAGLQGVWIPRAFGGLELEPLSALRLFEELSRIDGSAGRIVGNAAAGPLLSQVFPDEGAAEIFADPRTVLAGSFNPPGSALPVAGGYRVSGQWAFNSGCNYANWLVGLCLVMDGQAPRPGPDGNPVLAIVAFKADEAAILDNWDTLGMRDTGSHDVRVADLFVPCRRSFLMAPWSNPGSAFRGPLYRKGPWPLWCQVAVTGLGIARAALGELIALAATKTPSYTQTPLADRPVVQDGVARAKAQIDAARSYVYTAMGEAWEFVQAGQRLTAREGLPIALAASRGMEAAVRAVELVHSLAGTTAIRNERRFQQYFRDVHTISQHAFAS
ncbi:MAG TPA: acyl-CoA dehydrogenase family protein, partial [Dehalococcoidia bacterium]|nr:acyl-CoA dehydrogenase family protein [Dehalococcoidia bacterium]